MAHRWTGLILAVGGAMLSLTTWACASTQQVRSSRREQVDTGATSLEATRKALEGSWTLASLEVVDGQGARRPVKASGRLTYDAFGAMTVRGVIEDPALQSTLVLNYDGRIVIDTARLEFHAADLVSDRAVDPGQIAPISPDKVRRYELAGDSFVVTYLDAAARPTAVARWRRAAR